jgi:purine-binding chemotaxis protein CheW
MSKPVVPSLGASAGAGGDQDHLQLVTVTCLGQLFGLPIGKVRDVFPATGLTRVPLASGAIAGLFNLRGKVVTMLSASRILYGASSSGYPNEPIAIGLDWRGEAFGLLVENVGEVLSVRPSQREPNPAHLHRHLAAISAGIHRLDGRLLIELDIDTLLDMPFQSAA